MQTEPLVHIAVRGDRELERFFKRALPQAIREATREALNAGARHLLEQIQLLTPVRTGNLRKFLRVKSLRYRHGLAKVVVTPTRARLGIAPDDPGYYPAFVEYLHQSYLRRGAQHAAPIVFHVVEATLRDAVRRSAKTV